MAITSGLKPVLGTAQATTSGTSIDFTGIPSWVKKITISLVGVSTNGTSDLLLQLGDSGGIEPTGYLAATSAIAAASAATASFTTGFGISNSLLATSVVHGQVVLVLEDAAGFTWTCSSSVARSDAAALYVGAGSKSLSAALDRIRITTVGGVNTFDAGSINILYE